MNLNEIDISLFTETNINTCYPKTHNLVNSYTHTIWNTHSTIMSSTPNNNTDLFHRGGVITTIYNTISGRVKSKNCEQYGRWNNITLFPLSLWTITILTAYMP